MPKIRRVAAKDFSRVEELAEQLHSEICSIISDATKGYHEDLESPFEMARTFINLSGSSIKLSQFLLAGHDLKVQRDRIEAAARKELS